MAMRIGLALMALLLVLPVPGLAQDAERRTFGTPTTFVALTVSDFVGLDSTVTFQVSLVAGVGRVIHRTNPSGFNAVVAPLHLPEGAVVTEMEAVFCDTSPTTNLVTFLITQPRNGSTVGTVGPSSETLETPGCVDRSAAIGGTPIDNNNNAYYVEVDLGAADSSILLQSVRVGYHLQVSPAPVTATFTDVPTSHPFFQWVEALVAAGITTGCNVSPPMYCPDDAVTRGQMAAFISRALGLQFAP
jgi:hypothetical protein